MNIVCLPATAPGDTTYGEIPQTIEGFPDATVHAVTFPRLVWYNQQIQDQAIAQICALDMAEIILVGFSKSGLGAWNIARTIPERIAATLIFDSPVTRQSLPPWGTAPFYDTDEAWQKDLPLKTLNQFHTAMPAHHQLILISGPGFMDEMAQLSSELQNAGHTHTYLERPDLKHHWNSGWIDVGLQAIP